MTESKWRLISKEQPKIDSHKNPKCYFGFAYNGRHAKTSGVAVQEAEWDKSGVFVDPEDGSGCFGDWYPECLPFPIYWCYESDFESFEEAELSLRDLLSDTSTCKVIEFD